MQTIVKSLGTVLGEDHQKMQGLRPTMNALSDTNMESVAETIAESITQLVAHPVKGRIVRV